MIFLGILFGYSFFGIIGMIIGIIMGFIVSFICLMVLKGITIEELKSKMR